MKSQNGSGDRKYSKKFKDFLKQCLLKDPAKRSSATALLSHGFMKNAKNADYLKEHVMSMFNDHKEVQKGSVPHSVEQRMKLQKQKEMQTASHSDTTAMRK